MLIGTDTKLLVVHRRLFIGDDSRYFTGKVEGYEEGIAKIRGHTWARDAHGMLRRKDDERTKIVALASGTFIVYQLPMSTDLDKLEMRTDRNRSVWLTDGKDLEMDLTEKAHF